MLEKNNPNESTMTEVNFTNQPKYSEHEVDKAFNERREKLLPLIKELISKHPLFLNKKTEATIMHSGISSLVCILDTGKEKIVLKIPLSKLNPKLEGKFLSAWENAGVKTPHVFEEGPIGEHHYILMEYIGEKTISDLYTKEELISKKIYKNLGATLKKMHTPKVFGYSAAINNKEIPEYSNFSEWIEKDKKTKDKFKYVEEHKLLDDKKHGSTQEAIQIIKSILGDSGETTYCHDDFHTGNIFATNPITVFDPRPTFNHPYIDIARSIIQAEKYGLEEVEEQFLDGYFNGEKYNRKLLQAFMILSTALKLPYIHKINKTERIKRIQEYLEKTRKYLE